MNNQCAAPSSMGNEPIFAELAATTNYSFLRGASHPSDMVGKAMELGYAGVGIADRNSVAGVVRAYVAVREAQEKAEQNIRAEERRVGQEGVRGGRSRWSPIH